MTGARRLTRAVGAAVASACFCASCGDLGFTSVITGRQAWDPPAMYRSWWALTEDCARVRGDFDRVRWYLATGITGDGAVARARWSPPHDIVIVSGYERDASTVRHEILHDLLGGDRTHRASAWRACELG